MTSLSYIVGIAGALLVLGCFVTSIIGITSRVINKWFLIALSVGIILLLVSPLTRNFFIDVKGKVFPAISEIKLACETLSSAIQIFLTVIYTIIMMTAGYVIYDSVRVSYNVVDCRGEGFDGNYGLRIILSIVIIFFLL